MPDEGARAEALGALALAGSLLPSAADVENGATIRALVVGAETGKLAAALRDAGATHVLVVDHSRAMLDRAAEAFDAAGTLGNEPGVRFERCDVGAIKPYQGPFDAIVFNDTLEALADPRDALAKAALLAKPGARVVVSRRRRDDEEKDGDGDAVDVAALALDLPLEAAGKAAEGKVMVGETGDDSEPLRRLGSDALVADFPAEMGEAWTFEVPPLFALKEAVAMRAPVVTGFGRGSRQMGVPTANLDPEVLESELANMRRGVYFGFARLPDDPKHAAWCKCVVNVGNRPTFADGEGVTVEVHALRDFGRDFYGERMEAVVLGYLRPEMRFDGLAALVGRIMTDIGAARGALDDEACRERVDQSAGFQTGE